MKESRKIIMLRCMVIALCIIVLVMSFCLWDVERTIQTIVATSIGFIFGKNASK